MRRSVLLLAIIAAVSALSSAAHAGGWGWGGWGGCGCGGCGGCVPAYYANGLIARAATPFYLVNQGPVYSGPALVTYPVYAARSYPYVGGCGYGGCYPYSYSPSYAPPVGYYDYGVRRAPRVVYVNDYRGRRNPSYRLKRNPHLHPLPPK